MKDWTGTAKSNFLIIGASNHTDSERQREDYYATDPQAARLLLKHETFNGPIWEPACGENHLTKVFQEAGYKTRASDLINRCDNEVQDFLAIDNLRWDGDIITNPPYKYAQEFVEKALQIIPEGHKVAMFLKLTFMEGKRRKHLFTTCPPRTIYVSSSRLLCAKNGEFQKMIAGGGSAVAYAWYVWEKGYKGDSIVKWIN